MKWLVIFIMCATIALLQGAALASPTTVGDEQGEATRTCPMSAEDDETSRHGKLVDRVLRCVQDYDGIEGFDAMNTLEECRQFFNSYCQQIPRISSCFDGVIDTADICVNQTHRMILRIMKGLLTTLINTGCENDGERLAQVFHGFEGTEGPANTVNRCFSSITVNQSNVSIGTAEKVLLFHQRLDEMKDCIIGEIKNDDEELKAVIRIFLDDLRKDLHCIHPQDHVLVLCSSIHGAQHQ